MSQSVAKKCRTKGVLPLGIAAAVALSSAAPAGAERLTAGELKQKIPGAVIHLDTPLGSVVPITYGADGLVEGKAGAVAFYLGSERDRGKWWIEGSSVCHQWNTWFNGKKTCFTVYLKTANRIEWTDQDGDKGTATIVAMGNATPAPTQQTAAAAPQAQPALPLLEAAPARPARLGANSGPAAIDAKPAPTPPPLKFSHARPAVAGVPKAETKPEPKVTTEKPAPSPSSSPSPPPAATPPRLIEFRVANVAADDVLNLRRGPTAATDIVATIPPSTAGLKLAGNCNGEWCPVVHGPHFGWVHRYFIAASSGSTPPPSAQPSRNPISYRVVGVTAGDVLNIRRVPDADADVIATIPPTGNRIRLTGYCRREWCPVSHGRNEGWVNRQYLAVEF